MSSEIVKYEDLKALSKDLSVSQLLPVVLRKKPEDLLAIVLAGSELGLGPMQSIRGFHIIQGKISMSADLMGALVKRSPLCEYLQLIESTDKVATWETKRRGNPSPTRLSYTFEDAKRAGLTANPNYQKHPAAMLRARGESAICRAEYQDLVMGVYDTDELPERDVSPVSVSGNAHVPATVSVEIKDAIRAQVVDAELVEPPEPGADVFTLADAHALIAAANTADELAALVSELKQLSPADLKIARDAYTARKAQVTQ